jgi:DNA-binding transcriptional ArsR family regulator
MMRRMTSALPAFAEAALPPELAVVRPSLAAAMPTTMLFVDYALAGLTTPTFHFQNLADSLPFDVVEASWPLRAVLAHGAFLRSVTMAQLPLEHPGHREWTALREWYEAFSDERILGLVESGVRSVLALGDDEPEPLPPSEVAGMRGTLGDLTRDGARVLEIWGVPEPATRVTELLDPELVRSSLLTLLDEIWARWLRQEWTERVPELDAAFAAAPAPAPGCGGAQWITLVTGLVPDRAYAEAADGAGRLALMPCPGLERSLAQVVVGPELYVLFSPRAVAASPAPCRSLARLSTTRLARLNPVLQALGDQTRLAIVLRLLDKGPLTMQELTEVLAVHQTTISRGVATLRRARLVDQDDRRRVSVNRDELRGACQTLLDAVS